MSTEPLEMGDKHGNFRITLQYFPEENRIAGAIQEYLKLQMFSIEVEPNMFTASEIEAIGRFIECLRSAYGNTNEGGLEMSLQEHEQALLLEERVKKLQEEGDRVTSAALEDQLSSLKAEHTAKLDDTESKPPIGVKPDWAWKELRIIELDAAIRRYDEFYERPMPVTVLWRREALELAAELAYEES